MPSGAVVQQAGNSLCGFSAHTLDCRRRFRDFGEHAHDPRRLGLRSHGVREERE
jgi:hypothetical protein